MPKFCLYIFIYLMHLVVSFPCVNFPVVFHGYKTNNGHFCSKKASVTNQTNFIKTKLYDKSYKQDIIAEQWQHR